MDKYVIGLDFGSLSGRALLVNVATGDEVAVSSLDYPHGVMYDALPDGTPLPPQSAIQHPQDYLDVISTVFVDVMKKANVSPEQVIGVGIDFTSATVLPVDQTLTPLCFDPAFASHPKAYVTMWKDHTAEPQAKRIDEVCNRLSLPYLSYFGGKCSSENGLAKILCILQSDENVYRSAYRILEAGDWITMLLTGTEKKGFNFASCKEFWIPSLGGYPPPSFMRELDPRFEQVVQEKFGGDTVSYDPCFGTVTASAAKLTGLREGTPVATPYIDGYAPMPACGIVEPGKLAMIVGTSLCHYAVGKEYREVPGMFSSVPDCFYKGYTVFEGGQSSCGDHLAWFIDRCLPVSYRKEAEEQGIGIHSLMREKLKNTRPGESGLLCLDWFNGNRSVLNDSNLSGLIVGLTLQTRPEDIYRALLEGTVFGTRRILESYDSGGVELREIIACGGIAQKDPFMMQMFADVTNRPIRVCSSVQAPAAAAAMFAAVAVGSNGGGYDSIQEASAAMMKLSDAVYRPDPTAHKIYNKLYEQYKCLHDMFGCEHGIMKRLREIQNEGSI